MTTAALVQLPELAECSASTVSSSIQVSRKARDKLSKTGFSTYVNERFSGFGGRSEFQADDVADYPDLAMRLFATPAMAHIAGFKVQIDSLG